MSQSLEEGTLKKASHPPTLKAPGAWPPSIMTQHLPQTPAFSREINQGRPPWAASPPGGLRTRGGRSRPQPKLRLSLPEVQLQSSSRLWASSHVHLPGEGGGPCAGQRTSAKQGCLHQHRSPGLRCPVLLERCAGRGRPAVSEPEATLNPVAPLVGLV